MVRAPRKCSRARSALQRSRATLGSEAPGCAIARDSDPMMTGPMCSCQSSGARLPVAGQEGGAFDSHHALGRVSALGRALPVLYMSPCLPRAPWAPTFGVRCCSGGSASCSPCLGGSPSLRLASSAVGCPVPTSPFMGSWCVWLLFCCPSVNLRSAFLALIVSRGFAAAAPGFLYHVSTCSRVLPRLPFVGV